MKKFATNIFRSMLEARQLEANRQIAGMKLACDRGAELDVLRVVVQQPKDKRPFLDHETLATSLCSMKIA